MMKIIEKPKVFEGFQGPGEVQDGSKMGVEGASKTGWHPRGIKLGSKRAQEGSKSENKVVWEGP